MSFSNYLKEVHDTNKYIENFTETDIGFAERSIRTWRNRHNHRAFDDSKKLRPNQIVFADFGMAYKPELAFCHPCLLLRYDSSFCKVLPITTGTSVI